MAMRKTWVCLAFSLLLGVALPACKGPEGRPGRSYSAYKPKPEVQPKRTLFLGGYAGYNYGPIKQKTELPTNEGSDMWGQPISRKSAETHPELR